jgi:hypothetical protein
VRLPRGEEDIVDFLEGRVRAHGGETRLGGRVERVHTKRGKVTAVTLDGDESPTGVQFIVTDLDSRALLDRLADPDAGRRGAASLPELLPVERRFVVSMIVRDQGLPAPLADEAFLLPAPAVAGQGAPLPLVHLQQLRGASGMEGATLLVAEALLPEEARLEGARGVVLDQVQRFLPFVERHFVLVDSPHDGRPLWDYRGGERREVDRTALRAGGAFVEPEPMTPRWRVEPRGMNGLAAEPLRGPVGNTFVVGRSAIPALGQEGELLAAWGAARLITKTDRRKEKMRRDMWSKIELG